MKSYGKELILDLHDCDSKTFNRGSIRKYFKELCKLIDMKRCDVHFWDDRGVPEKYRQVLPHTKGTSAIQFIVTSNIVIHTLDELGNVYINIFSCKDFSTYKAIMFSKKWFKGRSVTERVVVRQ